MKLRLCFLQNWKMFFPLKGDYFLKLSFIFSSVRCFEFIFFKLCKWLIEIREFHPLRYTWSWLYLLQIIADFFFFFSPFLKCAWWLCYLIGARDIGWHFASIWLDRSQAVISSVLLLNHFSSECLFLSRCCLSLTPAVGFLGPAVNWSVV